MKPRRSALSPLSCVTVLALAAALGAALGCGPQKKFCPEIPNGKCPIPEDAAAQDAPMMDAAGEERGSIYIPGDDAQ
jgi:hypothetical protein